MTTDISQDFSRNIWPSFDPLHRSDSEEIRSTVRSLAEHPVVAAVLDSANVAMVVINSELEIVAANRTMIDRLGPGEAVEIHGQRLGDVLHCHNAVNCNGGCGSTEDCERCGAVRVALTCREKRIAAAGECLMTARGTRGVEAMELDVRATPVAISGEQFIVIALRDISDTKRRRVLERLFIHDLRNTLAGLIGWSETLADGPDDVPQAAEAIEVLSRRLAREVDDHRMLMAVEAGEYRPRPNRSLPLEIVENLSAAFEHHPIAAGRTLELEESLPEGDLITDQAVLSRVLTNMLTNAFEATPAGGAVRLGCREHEGRFRFRVWNEGTIPADTAKRIFQRSFSTKGEDGRGLGSYSMKLFGERALGGRVWFESNAGGTAFYLDIPRDL